MNLLGYTLTEMEIIKDDWTFMEVTEMRGLKCKCELMTMAD